MRIDSKTVAFIVRGPHYKLCLLYKLLYKNQSFEAGRGAAARGVTAKLTDCGFDPHSRR